MMEDWSAFHKELEGSSVENAVSLDDLPDACLIPILQKISSENMDDVSMVCQRWDKVVQDNIAVEIWASDIGFRIVQRFFYHLHEVQNYIIKSLVTRVAEERFPQLKAPDALEFLEFVSQTTLENFQTLTNQTINLKTINFENGSLTLEDISMVQLDLPNLEVLSIMDREFESKDIKAPENLSKNIIGLLQKHFPSIKSITLSTVATRRLTEQYGIELLRFLQNSSCTIKRVKIDIGTAIKRQPLEDYGSLDHSVILDEYSASSLNWNQLSEIRLDELDLDFGLKYFVGMEEWRRIVSNQDTLAHINFSLRKPLPVIVTFPAVTLSACTLVTIQLGLEVYRLDHPLTPVDCSIFEPCVNLKRLVLIANAAYEDRPRSKELFDTHKIPKSIETVAIENLLMVETDVESLFLDKPNLRKVKLDNVGCEGEFGMTLPLLSKILDHLQLAEIIVKGINGDECQFHYYDHLMKLGLCLPLNKSVFHVTFFTHFMEYMFAGPC